MIEDVILIVLFVNFLLTSPSDNCEVELKVLALIIIEMFNELVISFDT